jgi:hypothetical protein
LKSVKRWQFRRENATDRFKRRRCLRNYAFWSRRDTMSFKSMKKPGKHMSKRNWSLRSSFTCISKVRFKGKKRRCLNLKGKSRLIKNC